jgi:hypothetical protein
VESSSAHREVTANRPDVIIKSKTEMTCTLIDVAIPADRNVVQKKVEKKLKYKSLSVEIQPNVEPEMYDYTSYNWSHWDCNEKLKENLGDIPGKNSIDSLQKTAILGTSHIIWKVLQCET